ncbi:MAG: VOC family protein, partial [Sphingobacterium sp.]
MTAALISRWTISRWTISRIFPIFSKHLTSLFRIMDDYKVPSQTRIGHVHLKVADLTRALAFYQGVLGFELTTRYGDQAAFVSAGG